MFKSKFSTVSKETKAFFELINDGTINISKVKKYDHLFDVHKITESRKNLEEFLESWNGVGDVSTAYQSWMKANSKSTLNFSSLTQKAGSLLKSFGASLGSMAVNWAIGKVIELAATAIYNIVHASEIAREKSAELTDKWDEENSSINANIEKYTELKSRLDDTSLSAAEVKSIKEELLAVQDSLTEKYGQEALGLDLVNGKYEEQLDKLKELSRQKAQEYIAENYSNIQADKKYVSEVVNLASDLHSGSTMESINDKFGFDLEEYTKKYDKLSIGKIDFGKDGTSWTYKLNTNGTREEIYEQLSQLFNDLVNDFGDSNEDVNKFKSTLSKIIQDSFDTEQLKTSKENIRTYAEAEILSQSNTRKLYEEASNAVDAYNEALQSGKGVEEAKKKLDSIKETVKTETSDIYGADDVFNDIFNGINKSSEITYKISSAFENNNSIKDYAKQLEGLSADDLLKIDFTDNIESPGEKAFKGLMDSIGLTKEQTQDLIDKLIELGYIQGEIQDDAPSAYSDSLAQLLTFSEGLDQLSQIYADVSDKGDFNWGSILNNEEFKDTFGTFSNEYDDFIKTVSNSPDDINACQSAFNRLATTYINGSDAMKNLSAETKDTTIKLLEQMGITNAQEIVTTRLAAQEDFLAAKKNNSAIASGNLTDATWNEISAVLASGNASAETTTYLAQLALAKLNLSENPIDTTDDINAIIALANAAGTSGKYVEALETTLAHLDTVQSSIKEAKNPFIKMGLLVDETATKAEASRLTDVIKNEIAETQLNPEDFYVNLGGGSKNQNKDPDTDASDVAAAAEETAETFNWLETTLSRVQRTIQTLSKAVSATWQSWTKRNTALASQLSETRREIALQQAAYEQYMAKAESIGLSESYKALVQNGSLSIEDITDETLKEQIHDYQDWYEKALSCRDAIDDLSDSISSLYKTDFDNTSSQFDSFLSVIEHRCSMLDAAISQTEEKGLLVSAEYYKALIRTEEENLAQLAQKKSALLLSLNNAVANGAIEEYSQEWYDMCGQIDGVTQAIEEASTAMIQYGNSIREIKWEVFDLLQERISDITSESGFLLDLFENDALYDKDSGKLTDEGQAAMGNMNQNLQGMTGQFDTLAETKIQSIAASSPAAKLAAYAIYFLIQTKIIKSCIDITFSSNTYRILYVFLYNKK